MRSWDMVQEDSLVSLQRWNNHSEQREWEGNKGRFLEECATAAADLLGEGVSSGGSVKGLTSLVDVSEEPKEVR
jgi:hypothetical protein